MVDPRIAERRRAVLEKGARKGIRRAVIILSVVTTAAALIWLAQSPWLSVSTIEVMGTGRADVLEAIAGAGVVEGRPLLLINEEPVVEAVEGLPWIESASVERIFPSTVRVDVDQRRAVAWVWASGEYAMVDARGNVLEYQASPQPIYPVLRLAVERLEPGARYADSYVLGAIEFSETTGSRSIELWQQGEELWAMTDGVQVRLGRPIDMAAKAVALLAVLEEGVSEGSLVNLIAPTRPAVTPGAQPSS